MGEYEDRYPEAYGRGDETVPRATETQPSPADPGGPRERSLLRRRFGLTPPQQAERRREWEHAPVGRGGEAAGEPAPQPIRVIEPVAQRPPADYRGIPPRGYIRSPQRIYEDVCDRLTDDPLVDPSEVEVKITGVEVTLSGNIDSREAAERAATIAAAVPGVRGVRNALGIRPRAVR